MRIQNENISSFFETIKKKLGQDMVDVTDKASNKSMDDDHDDVDVETRRLHQQAHAVNQKISGATTKLKNGTV